MSTRVSRFAFEVLRGLDAAGVNPGDKLVVAYSGGPDSSALLHALLEIAEQKPERAFRPEACHVDHGMHDASGEIAEHIRIKLAELKVPRSLVRRVVSNYAKKGESPEAAARRVRYEVLSKIANDWKAKYVLTGHTASDRVEGFLLRLVRGTSGGSFTDIALSASLPYGKAGQLALRPMIELKRADVLEYVYERGIETFDDPTNTDERFSRNFVRGSLIPLIQREMNPKFEDHVLHFLATSGADKRPSATAGDSMVYAFQPVDDASSKLDEVKLFLETKAYDHSKMTRAHFAEIVKALKKPRKGFEIDLPGAKLVVDRIFGFRLERRE
ncbi:MAG: tRNA lysidine(34) synthetase TilS [Planctomycetes bacterium]|nr:tRNA lysidine(34) synthetase TilS [Planctomycetota bacterium]